MARTNNGSVNAAEIQNLRFMSINSGSGLSSSSALTVALTIAFADLAQLALTRTELAQLALAAEVAATGVPGGLMDQLCSLHGVADRMADRQPNTKESRK